MKNDGKTKTPTIRTLFALGLIALIAGCAATGPSEYGISPESLETLQDDARNAESALPLPAFELSAEELEDGRVVAVLDGDALVAFEIYLRHSEANRDALEERTLAFSEAVDALVLYDDAVRDLESALRAERMSCRIWTGAVGIGGFLVGSALGGL